MNDNDKLIAKYSKNTHSDKPKVLGKGFKEVFVKETKSIKREIR